MKKLFLVIISFFFANNVYATNLEYTTTQYYSLTENERIEKEEEKDNGLFQYFILIVAFLGISAVFIFLKDSDE